MPFNPHVIAAQVGISVGLHYLNKWLADPPEDTRFKKWADVPVSEEGTPWPIVLGKCRVRRPVLMWSGGFRHRNLQIGGNSPDLVTSWFYGLNLLFGVGLPHTEPGLTDTKARLMAIYFDESLKINFDQGGGGTPQEVGRAEALPGNYGMNVPFVGTEMFGLVQFFDGRVDQLLSDNHSGGTFTDLTEIARFMRKDGVDGTLIPGYRNKMLVSMTGAVGIGQIAEDNLPSGALDAFYFGRAPALPLLSFEILSLRRHYLPLVTGNSDDDPVDAIFTVLTSAWGCCGVDAARIDDVSFLAASETLFIEFHGYSNVIDTRRNGRAVLQEIVDQIGAVLYEDPVDSKYHLKLLRNDYDPDTIPYFDARHVESVERWIVGGWPDKINRVLVRFEDRARHYVDSTAVATSQAGAVLQDPESESGKIRDVTVEYAGCKTLALAKTLAQRDLNLLSQPLSQLRIVFNRRLDIHGTSNAAQLRPGMTFKLALPEHYIFDVIFRITSVDPGQLGDSKVTVDAVTDVFGADAAIQPQEPVILYLPVPYPLRDRVLTEAPRWLQYYAEQLGQQGSPDIQRILVAARPTDSATDFSVLTSKMLLNNVGAASAVTDTAFADFPFSAKVAVAYGREKEPYDNTTGLVIDSFYPSAEAAATIVAASFAAAVIANRGISLILVGAEIMAYESATDLGGGQIRLNNVWRAELDTAPADHAVGVDVYWIGLTIDRVVGRRGWSLEDSLQGRFIPQLGIMTGSGDDPVQTLALRQRCQLPIRVADLSVVGKNMLGTLGIPAAAGRFKSLSLLEEGIDVFALRRDRKTTTVIRGDAVDETQTEAGIQYKIIAQKGDAEGVLLATLNNAAAIGGLQGYLVGGAGHGVIDLIATTVRTVQAGEVGVGIPIGTLIECWDSPSVRMVCPRWRNLLANSRFDYDNLTVGWEIVQGSCVVVNDSSAIPRDFAGNPPEGFYFASAVDSVDPTIRQIVDVAGYLARKMTARLVWYQRAINADADDTATVTLDPLDAAGASLGGAATLTATAAGAFWTRRSISIASLPALTSKLEVEAVLTSVTGEFAVADLALTEFELIVGQHLYDVLLNPSFEDGSTVTWTNVTNSFAVVTAIQSPSEFYAQGGAFASSAIRQDYALVTGWEVGATIVLRAWRAQTIAGDTGRILLQCLDGAAGVLEEVNTGVEDLATLNQWVRRRLSIDVPVGTVTVRVLLEAVRTGGAGNSGACFDELVLSVHKQLDAGYERILEFDAPTEHLVPSTWQRWVLAFPDLVDAGIPAPAIFAGGNPSTNIGTTSWINMRWSDDAVHAASSMIGQFGGGVVSVDAYRFTRQAGAGALDFQTTQEDVVRFMAPSSAESFSVLLDFQVDEPGFATACGLLGRRDAASGWDLGIDATGHVTAIMQGVAGTITAVRPATTVHDGALHLAAIVYDAVAETVTVYDERGGTSESTAAGLGEIANLSEACQFRIGRGRPTVDTLPGMISRVRCFPGVALSSAQVAAQWNYGKDPNETALVYTRDVAAWAPNTPNGAGETLVCMATDQIALGYDADLTTDDGTGLGLALVQAETNLIPSWDFAGASWTDDGATVLTQGIVDATGLSRGVTVYSPDITDGFKVSGITVDATVTVKLVMWARADAGTPTIEIELMSSADVIKDTQVVVLSDLWTRYQVDFTGWDAATATCRIRFRSGGGVVTFDLSHVMLVVQGEEIPALIPGPLVAIADVTASLADATIPTQFNAEGEIVAVGVATVASPAGQHIATVSNGTDLKNFRSLQSTTSQEPTLVHYSSVPANAPSTGSAIDWSLLWTIRGRWCSLGTLDNAANAFAGIVTDADVDSAVYGRAATWTYDATTNDLIEIGIGGAALNCYLRSLTVRAREQKLV